MCEVLDRAEARGEAHGMAIGELNGMVKCVRDLMDIGFTLEKALETFHLTGEMREKVIAALN